MKRCMLTLALVLGAAARLFAYNPPYGGEDLQRLASPQLLSGGASASGGPLFTVIPASITYNPALTALEQRSVLDLSGAFILDTDDSDGSDENGWGFQAGLLIPNKWMVFSVTAQGLFCENWDFYQGKNVVIHSGLSKEVTERLLVGANIYTGFYMGNGSGFTVGADLGMLYMFSDIAEHLKAPRLGVSLLNLGKPLSGYDVLGIHGVDENSSYPGILTPRASFAATLLERSDFTVGFSADLSFPTFQNLLFDVELAGRYKDIVEVNLGWDMNARELANGGKVSWPSLGVKFKLAISTKSEKVKESWQQSEIVPSVAWQNMNGGIHDMTAGATLYLGLPDRQAPEIFLWEDAAREEPNGGAAVEQYAAPVAAQAVSE